jgi:hypothetical protein
MIKRLVWLVIGAALGAFAIKKVRDYLRKSTPEAIGHRLVDSAGGLGESAGAFIDRARAAMAEREAELRDTLGLPQPNSESWPADETAEPEHPTY